MGTGIKVIDNFLNITLEKKLWMNSEFFVSIKKYNYLYLSGASPLYQKKGEIFLLL